MADLVPILLRTGQRAMVPRKDMETAMSDPLAAPVPDVVSPRPNQRLRPVLLQSGQVAQVPTEDYQTAIGDPLAHGEQGQATMPVPLARGGSARVPLGDVGAALRDPLALEDPSPRRPVPVPDAEDEALAELAESLDAAGLGGAPATQPAPVAARRPMPTRPRGDTAADVDALGSAWDDFYGRAQQVDVENVPSTVPLASRLGGEPLPGLQRPEATPQQPQRLFGEGDTLTDAQRRERLLRGLGGIAGSTSRMGYLIAGVKPPEEDRGEAALAQDASTQVRDYMLRRQQSEADKASALKTSDSDPTSPASQRFQAMVSRAFGSVYTPEQISQMTAADAPLVGRYGEMVRTLEDRAAARAAAQQSEQAQLAARSTEAEAQRRFQAQEGARDRANAREIAGMRQGSGGAGGRAEADFQRRMSERNVGGFEIDPANPPTAEGAKRMAAAVDARGQIKGSLDRLEQLFNEYGTEMGGGAAQSEMEAELGNITTQLRLFNQMGVPNLNDYTELAKQIPQTAGVGAWFTREGTIRPKFKTLKEQLDRAVNSTATAYKFKPSGGGPQRVGMQGDMDLETPPGERHQYSPSRNRTRVLDAQGNVIREYEGQPNA